MCNKSVLCAALFLVCALGCERPPLYKSRQVMLGTFVEVISDDKSASGIVFKEIRRAEGLLSKYDPASEISRLNKEIKLQVSPETFYIIERAKYFWQSSSGAFDITVGPLLDLWGFSDKKLRRPDPKEIEDTLAFIGSDKIVLDKNKNVVKLGLPGMKLDLGAIAKGYAVDCAVRLLREKGVRNCLINAGGDIYCLGTNFGRPWRVAVQDPRNSGVLGELELKDAAVATSGDYAQCFIEGKSRYSHIMNPKTGYPSDSGVASVTVVAPDCLTADALATAVSVLGRQKGERLLEHFPDAKARIIEGEKDV